MGSGSAGDAGVGWSMREYKADGVLRQYYYDEDDVFDPLTGGRRRVSITTIQHRRRSLGGRLFGY